MRERIWTIVSGALSSLLAAVVSAQVAAWTPPRPHVAPALPMTGYLQPSPGHSIPAEALRPADPVALHRHILDRSNLLAPPEVYQGQVYQESRYITDAVSPAGAVGPAQFLKATWEKDTRPRLPARCQDKPRTHAECAFLGQVEYIRMVNGWLPIEADHDVTMAAYNAGAGSIGKEQQACATRPGCDPTRWEGSLENLCLRGSAACAETRNYVPRIRKASRQFRLDVGPDGPRASFSLAW